MTATRSFIVVMRGPYATAGSTLIFLKKSGIRVPTALDISIATIIDTPIQPETAKENDAAFFFIHIM